MNLNVATVAMRALVASAVVAVFALCCDSACAHHFRYTANLSGAAESTPNNSSGTGHAVITVDLDLGTITIDTTFANLAGVVTEAHINAVTASVGTGTAIAATPTPAFDGFPLGVSNGQYDREFDLALASTYDAGFIAASGGTISDAYNALVLSMDAGKAYFNIATSAFPNGEIRGFLSYVPGDFNDDGVVDAADYVVWRSTLGQIGEGLHADANNDDIITDDDYAIWRENFGSRGLSNGAGSGFEIGSRVPEPSTILLSSITCGALSIVRRRNPRASRCATDR